MGESGLAQLLQDTLAGLLEGECGHDCYCTFGYMDSPARLKWTTCSSGRFAWMPPTTLSRDRSPGCLRRKRRAPNGFASTVIAAHLFWDVPHCARCSGAT